MEIKKPILDVDVDVINDTISSMFSEMMGSLTEYLEKCPNQTLDFEPLLEKALNNATMKAMFPMIQDGCPSYVSKLYIKESESGYEDIYAKKINDYRNEYDVNGESFQWVLNLCEFIKLYC